ncbi:hypothetical protein BFS30_19685 [Pedobacter steynii]|uniref:Uncharacterized protein n=1 Tax=Pedobacter steynii TaxID=430522 RepID=A0A1D7QKI6_9SPHI|nr:hypothetical protein BFS30_19685 [Pedobacter steynii]
MRSIPTDPEDYKTKLNVFIRAGSLEITDLVIKKWTTPVHNWGLVLSQLDLKFGDRVMQELKSPLRSINLK